MTSVQNPDTASRAPADEPTGRVKAKRPGLNTDTLAMAGLFIAVFAFVAALFAVGLAARAVEEHDRLAARLEASGGRSGVEASAGETVSLTEFAISPGTLEVPAGAVLQVQNDGTVQHNLSVDGTASSMLGAGDATQLDLSDLEPGTYTTRCDVPGHEAAGMQGTLTIG